MTILGINVSGFHSSACIVVDGKIISAITEERLSRIKRDKSFPKNAIYYCCEAAEVQLSDITDIYIGWNPVHYLKKSDQTLLDAMQNRGKIAHLALNELSTLVEGKLEEVVQEIRSASTYWKIHFVNHHEVHLSNVFCQSGFQAADFLVLDGFGEISSGCIGQVDAEQIKPFNHFRTPHSLGSLYSTFTEFLGFHPNGDEWKVMALASLGNPEIYYKKVRSLIRSSDLGFELDLSYFEHYLFFTPHYYAPKFIEVFGQAGDGENLEQRHYDLVAALQKTMEEVVFQMLNTLQRKTRSSRLVVSGGFFMNSVLNGKILQQTAYEEISIGGSPDDSGIGTGAALYGSLYHQGDRATLVCNRHNYFGKTYADHEIENELMRRKIRFEKFGNIAREAALLIKDNKIVAWYQGGSEFGQRALGNRSIVANPTNPEAKNIVNASIKYREGFRPFAPSVLEEDQGLYFENEEQQSSYFMERVLQFKPEFIEKLPAVVHFDGSGRLQTVNKDINPKYHELISEFKKLTGFGVLLNTSFNINGMPLVETPGDAINCFYQSGIDVLIMNNYLIQKEA